MEETTSTVRQLRPLDSAEKAEIGSGKIDMGDDNIGRQGSKPPPRCKQRWYHHLPLARNVYIVTQILVDEKYRRVNYPNRLSFYKVTFEMVTMELKLSTS